ncbi:MAG: cytochrome c1, partial [Pseudomonadota bacterium]
WIAMPQFIYDDSVEYADGTVATAQQITYDVTNFLHWAAEPHLEQRKRRGVITMAYLLIFFPVFST